MFSGFFEIFRTLTGLVACDFLKTGTKEENFANFLYLSETAHSGGPRSIQVGTAVTKDTFYFCPHSNTKTILVTRKFPPKEDLADSIFAKILVIVLGVCCSQSED